MSDSDSNRSLSYRDAGVDINRANEAKDRIAALAKTTFTSGVLSEIGLFGGLFRFDAAAYEEPVLVASTDGVGTKLKLATETRQHDTVGEDLVNHSVNDILVQGAQPLFFLDYFASAGLPADTVAEVVEGIARGCRANQTALIGGETAEMPGMYKKGEYDLAGTIIGVVDRKHVIDGSRIEAGNVLLGLPSTGLHTNGYSLARKVLQEIAGFPLSMVVPELGVPLGEALLRVHRSYLAELTGPIESGRINGLAHITGGGITENLPRILPDGLMATITRKSIRVPPLFTLIQERGRIELDEMYRTFNMGVGMIVVVAESDVDAMRKELVESFEVGRVVAGETTVSYEE